VEVEGLPVYSETYDVDTLAKELKKDEAKAVEIWSRRIKCAATEPDSARALLAASRMGVFVSAGIGTVSKSEHRFRRTWVKICTGISGWTYPLWRGRFCPRGYAARQVSSFDRDQRLILFASAP
jgi:hypothetical protein